MTGERLFPWKSAAWLCSLAFLPGCGGSLFTTGASTPPRQSGLVIDSFAPSSDSSASSGDSIVFLVNARDSEPLDYHWSIDGVPQQGGDRQFVVRTRSGQGGVHTIAVDVTAADQDSASILWRLRVVDTGGPPAPPPQGSSEVTVAWDPVTTDVLGGPETVAGYRVYVALSPQPFGAPVTTSTEPEALVSNLASGATYSVAVTAFDEAGNESSFSSSIDVVAP